MRNPKEQIASRFVVECLERIAPPAATKALDMPCGFGRHALLLANAGLHVTAIDLDRARMSCAKQLAEEQGLAIQWITADLQKKLPIRSATFDLVVIVHFVSKTILAGAREVLRPGGYLIYETFDARGENWHNLPLRGETIGKLDDAFRILALRERPAGPTGTHAAVRLLAARHETPVPACIPSSA